MSVKVVMLGTGTPNACPNASGPACAVIVKDKAYLIDCGPGVVRQCSKAYFKGIDALRPDLLKIAFITHLHSDHTAGLSDLILTPWVLERAEPLKLFGPKGLKEMADYLTAAYRIDIDFRLNGPEKANKQGYQTEVRELNDLSRPVFEDEDVKVYAFAVEHGGLESYGYRFEAEGKKIVISGDTRMLEAMKEEAKGADILVHEVEYTAGLKDRDPKWYTYHQEVHTLSCDLAAVLKEAQPRLIVTTHRIYHMNILDNKKDVLGEMKRRDELILQEIREAGYDGAVVNGYDLAVYEC